MKAVHDLVGRSRLKFSLLDDYSLVKIVKRDGTGKWLDKLQKLQNDKHVCLLGARSYESSKAA